jgi:RND superfamily putative drug exporter
MEDGHRRPHQPGLRVYVAGPAGYYYDSAKAFGGVDHALLFATVLVVILILLLAYRSPLLWLLPVISAGIALMSAEAVIYLLAKDGQIVVNAQSAGILTILVFGVGTDYALLLVARYREELRRNADRHQAMAIAMRRAGPAVIASAATVVVSLLFLQFADMNSTRGLGPVAAIGVVTGVLVMITLLPALLVITGRWIFWPARPAFGTRDTASTGRWARLGRGIARRPRLVWPVTALVLAACALGLTQLHATGLTDKDSFTGTPPSVVAQQVLQRHFPAGQDGQPVIVIGNADAAGQLRQSLAGSSGIAAVALPAVRGNLVLLAATLRAEPDSPAAIAAVQDLRTAVRDIPGADAKVGGQTAITMDLNAAQDHDNKLIIPPVLLVILVIIGLVLRAVVAPLLLVATVVLSFAAALGLSALAFHALGFHRADPSLPLDAFVFLVALGIDYNIFLMTRAREEARRSGTRQGMLTALAATGGVITSAGLVLAATFSVFATVPMVFFAELGITIALGIVLDTFIVRSIVVSALTFDIGRRIWWPGNLATAGPALHQPKPAQPASPLKVIGQPGRTSALPEGSGMPRGSAEAWVRGTDRATACRAEIVEEFAPPVSIAEPPVRSVSNGPDHSAGRSTSTTTNRETIMHTITSSDGTTIAYDRTGTGEPLVLVGGAFSYRRFPGQVKLAGELSARFTVYSYDRRGRGDSGDTPPYSVEREIEDLAAVIGAAGGTACVWGLSSGAVLALEAAAAGLPIRRLAVQEPPLAVDPADRRPPADLRQHVTELIDADQRGEAVRYYMTDGMGAPAFVPGLLRLIPGAWKKLTAVAHTLPYDAELVEPYQTGRPLPAGQWTAVTMPALVMCGTPKESPGLLRHGSAAVAAVLPDARLVQRRGLGHAKKLTPTVIAATLIDFFTSPGLTTSARHGEHHA